MNNLLVEWEKHVNRALTLAIVGGVNALSVFELYSLSIDRHPVIVALAIFAYAASAGFLLVCAFGEHKKEEVQP